MTPTSPEPADLLIEAGHNQNTLEEALGAMPYLAKAIAQELSGG